MSENKKTGLASIANESGIFSIIAMDQRNTLRKMFAAIGIEATTEDMQEAKIEVARHLTPYASGLLLDIELGVGAVLGAGVLNPKCGLLIAAENPDRGDFNGEPRPSIKAGQDGAWVKKNGGDALKQLVMMHPGRPIGAGEPDITAETVEVVREIIAGCKAAGVPSVIENLIYALPSKPDLSAKEKEDLIVESAFLLNDLKPDLLKLEYPGSPEGCRRLAERLTVPWAVLSAGVAFNEFEKVVQISCTEGGASGFIAGRSVWKESIGMKGAERTDFLQNVAIPRLEKLNSAVAGIARPYTEVGR
jgi:tagatose-1,6-bisphosphate aldolase